MAPQVADSGVVHLRLGYLASGAASSARGIHHAACHDGLAVTSAALVANNSKSGALEWATAEGIPAAHLSGKTHPDPEQLDAAVRDFLVDHAVDLVVLSGYAKLVGLLTLSAFPQRVLNVHPAPLPRFGGQGMYGMAVHQAVIDANAAESAVTIHHVTARYDEGPVVAAYPVPVERSDTARTLRNRAHGTEPDCWVDLLRRATTGEPLPGMAWLTAT